MKNTPWIIVAAIFIVILAVLAYIFNFSSQPISDDTSTWGSFSDYLNPFISLSNLVVFIWLSVEVFKYNKKKDDQTEEFQKSIEKPTLIFKSVPHDRFGTTEEWEIKNIGNGPALNLRIAESNSREIIWISPITKCYSLGKDESQQLDWLIHANVICVTYQDIFGNYYASIGADDETFITELNDNYQEITIEGKKFTLNDFIKFNQLPTQRLHAALSSGHHSNTTTSQTTNPNG